MTIFPASGTLVGRVWNPAVGGPSVVTLRKGRLLDITSRQAPLVRDICELEDPAGFVSDAPGVDLGDAATIAGTRPHPDRLHLLAPCDLSLIHI